MAKSAFTDSLLLMLLNHEDAFLGPEGHYRTAWDTKLLLTAVLSSPVDCISLCQILRAKHCSLSPNSCFTPPLAPHCPRHPPLTHPLPIDSICDIITTLFIQNIWLDCIVPQAWYSALNILN